MLAKPVVLAVLAFFLVACAPQAYWTKPGASDAEFKLTDYNCDRDSLQAFPNGDDFILRESLYDKCMDAHGWAKSYR